MQSLNTKIRSAIAINDLDRTRELLRQALQNSPDAETYYLASQVALSDEQKRKFLRKALDPFCKQANYATERLKLLSRVPLELISSFSEPVATLYKAQTGSPETARSCRV